MTQVAKVDVDDVLVADVVHAPHAIQQALAAEDDAGIPCEGQEQLELGRREFDRSAVHRDGPGRLVDDEIADLDAPRVIARGPSSRPAQ